MTKYLLVEYGDGGPHQVSIFDDVGARSKATREAILGPPDEYNKDTDCPEILELAENGSITFEGDPPLQWIDAEVPQLESLTKERDELKSKTSLEGFRSMGKQVADALDVWDALAIKVKDLTAKLERSDAARVEKDAVLNLINKSLYRTCCPFGKEIEEALAQNCGNSILTELSELRRDKTTLKTALEGMSELCGNYFDESELICDRDKFLWKQILEALAKEQTEKGGG